MEKVRVCLLGFGGIARSHLKGYRVLEAEGAPVELVGICDIDESQFTTAQATNLGKTSGPDLSGLNLYTNDEEMIAAEKPDVVDVCLPSYLHEAYAVKMLRAGCNVLCEKPMSLSSEACNRMIAVAEETGKKLMIGQCLRFEPAYLYLKDLVDSGKYGKVRYAHFDRLSALPLWGFEKWFQDTERSGGCIMDMHIHDVDMVRFLFGEPKSVSAVATERQTRWQVVNSRFDYGNGMMVVADGSWDESATRPFEMAYRVRFDDAELICQGTTLTVYPDDGASFAPELEKKNRMAEEILCLCKAVLGEPVSDRISAYEAAKTVALVEKLKESADRNGVIVSC